MSQPNILIFMTDHQRADTALPDHPAITPNLTRMVEEGVSFTNAYCPSPHCCPSRATFFTGLYPSMHGVWNNIANQQSLSRGIKDGVKLWSDDLADAGYNLHWSGKWHVDMDKTPQDYGWTEYFLTSGKGTFNGLTWDDYKRIAQSPPSTERKAGEMLRPGYPYARLYRSTGDKGFDNDENVIKGALKALDVIAEQDDDPFCLYVGLLGPHDPYDVPQRYLDMYDLDDVPLPVNFADTMQDKPRIYQRLRETRFGQLTDSEVRDTIRHFWAFCSYIDDLFGQVLNRLEDIGHLDDTLIVFCSDHGDYCGEHGLFAKGIACFKGAYHVPMVMRHPTLIHNPNRTVDQFVSLADIAPTLLDIAGCDINRHFAGASLLPFLRDEQPDEWRVAMFTQCNGVELYYTQRSVMTKDYKYVFNGFDHDELYDLRSDPHEMRNVADNPHYEAIKRDLCKKLWQFAYEQNDEHVLNPYLTVGLAPYGPAIIFEDV